MENGTGFHIRHCRAPRSSGSSRAELACAAGCAYVARRTPRDTDKQQEEAVSVWLSVNSTLAGRRPLNNPLALAVPRHVPRQQHQ